MRKFALILCLATMLAVTAAAQTPDRGRGTGDLAFGYTHLSGDIGKNGWNASGSYNFTRYVGAEADIAGYYGSTSLAGLVSADASEYSFLFGPKVRFETENPKLVPWAHLLFGAGHSSIDTNINASDADTAFVWALGGGADWVFRPKWAARAKLDLYHSGAAVESGSHLRFGLGLAYRWGGE